MMDFFVNQLQYYYWASVATLACTVGAILGMVLQVYEYAADCICES
ncbi:MAG: hypothetical protein IT249_03210 [Chitinophagaceae bacterium]|nr:hypothetical protein [Chitinophagaceae bacterium]